MENTRKLHTSEKPALVGVIVAWLGVQLNSLSVHVGSVGLDNVAWDSILYLGLHNAIQGLIALAALYTDFGTPPDVDVQQQPNAVQKSPDPTYDTTLGADDNVTYIRRGRHYGVSELRCKGMNCDCVYPGMSEVTLDIMDYVRDKWGKMFCNSGYRCEMHNDSLRRQGAAKNSFHTKARAGDIIPHEDTGVTPQQIYDDLCQKYPDQFGFGLYNTFVHIDDRRYDAAGKPVYGRKASPSQPWKQYPRKVDIDL